MTALVAKPDHGQTLVSEDKATDVLQLWFDELETQLNLNVLGDRVQLPSYTVATVPDATASVGMIFVTDETGGAVPAFSDLTNWRRVTDRVIVS